MQTCCDALVLSLIIYDLLTLLDPACFLWAWCTLRTLSVHSAYRAVASAQRPIGLHFLHRYHLSTPQTDSLCLSRGVNMVSPQHQSVGACVQECDAPPSPQPQDSCFSLQTTGKNLVVIVTSSASRPGNLVLSNRKSNQQELTLYFFPLPHLFPGLLKQRLAA